MTTLYTIGHSNRLLSDFLEILHAQNIKHLIDVRTVPKSRFVPWSNQKSLQASLKKAGIRYTHMAELGGLRHAHKDSINMGWNNASFRGFADYMQATEFYQALKKLNAFIKQDKTVIMCAESVPWRCHRSLIADAEIVRGIKVIHLISLTSMKEHVLTDFAVVDKKKRPIQVTYPVDK